MLNFREEYQKELKKMPAFRIEANRVQDELHHRKMKAARRRKIVMSLASAACIFMLCSVGTVTAVNYYSSTITVERGGFSFWGKPGKETATVMESKTEDYRLTKGSDSEEAGEEQADMDKDFVVIEDEMMQEKRYDSIEAFRKAEHVVIAIPEVADLGDVEKIEWQQVVVAEAIGRVQVMISFEGKQFFLSQADNRNCLEYSSNTVFMGDAVNEREVKQEMGLVWQVFDSAESGVVTSTHAALSVNGRDLILTFIGYEKTEIDAVLKQLDVSIYFIKDNKVAN